MASSRPPYVGIQPGTNRWMEIWRLYPAWQDEMLSHKALIEMGINPIEPVEGFRVSNSALQATACSVKALLRYGYRVVNPAKSWPLSVGVAVHKGLARYFRTGDVEGAYKKFLESYPEGDAPEERLHVDNVKSIMRHYLTDCLKHFPYYVHPDMVEIWFEQALVYGDEEKAEEPIVYVGRIDLLPEEPNSKAMMVFDWKTTGKIGDWWLKKWKMDSGLIGYMWAAGRFLPQVVFPESVIGALELPKLPQIGRKCRTHGVDYAECRKHHFKHQVFSVGCEQHKVEEWYRTALFQARRLRDLVRTYGKDKEGVKYVRMLGMYNGMCTFCEYVDFCLAGRPVEWIGSEILPKREDLEGMEG